MRTKLFVYMIAVIILTSCSNPKEVYSTSEGAIGGYDPVSFFEEGSPVKGLADYTYQWKGADWHFSTKSNLEKFKESPESFAPQFGGYCAYGTADGHKAPTEPGTFTIVDGKLYLNYNNDVKAMWMKDQTNLIEKANKNWSTVKNTKE
jgi:YHS domain-containing protein